MVRLLCLVLLTGCAARSWAPEPSKLQPWTMALRDQQPEEAFVAVYNAGSKHLIFIGAKHANKIDSPTFRMIEAAYAAFRIDTVIAEGFATSRGANPPTTIAWAARNVATADGFVEGGETVPTVMGAQREPATLLGGEADDLEIKAQMAAAGVSDEDLLGFYVLRNIPQWIGERQVTDAGDPRLPNLVVAALAKNRQSLQLPKEVLPDYQAWAAWYQRLNRRPIGSGFVTEEVGPLADGRFATNRIGHAISKARGTHLHNLIVAHLNARQTVLVVFGASHMMIHRPALDAVLGEPCYTGSDLMAAAAACR